MTEILSHDQDFRAIVQIVRPKSAGILIIDDEDVILIGLGDYFRSMGYRVDCARDLAQATRLLEDVQYELVISDMRLTRYGAEGLQVVGRAKERSPRTATILLTGLRSPELEAEARRHGVDLLLDKPFVLDKLGDLAVGLLQRRQSRVDNSRPAL